MQSHNLCSSGLLVFGRHMTHCLEIEGGAMWAHHSLTTTALCQMDHMNATSLPNWSGSHMWPIKHVVTREVALPFARHPSHLGNFVDDRVFAKFHSIVKEAKPFHPSPPIHGLSEGGHFAINEGNPLFLLPSSSTNNLNHVKGGDHFITGFLPLTKTFNKQGHGKMVLVHVWRSEVKGKLHDKIRILCPILKQPNPLAKECDLRVILWKMPPLVNDFAH